ncbi:MAG: helix-turn-helix domain-containing protein [Micrococcaceae bacterium]
MEDDNVLNSARGTESLIHINTDRVQQAEALGGTVYHPHEVRTLTRGAPFGMSLTAATFSGMTIGLLQYASQVSINTSAPRHDYYQVNFTAFGTARMGNGRVESTMAPDRAVIQDWTTPTQIRGWDSPARMIGVRIPRTLLENSASALRDNPTESPIALNHSLRLDTGAGSTFAGIVRNLARDLNQVTSTLTNPLIGAPVAESIIRLLLVGATEDHHQPPGSATSATIVARAIEYMEANARQPLTVEDIARSVSVSTRSLQLGFRQHRQTTPMTVLRDIRLDAARAEMENAAEGTLVTDVAEAWGFGNRGRFAHLFHQRFGVHPSEILLR